MTPNTSRFLKKLIPYVLIWLIAGILYLLLEKGIMGNSNTYPSTGNFYDFKLSIVSVLSFSTLLGTILGITEEHLFKNLLRKKPFFTKLLFKTILYVLIIVITLLLATFALNSVLMQLPPNDPAVVESVFNFFGNLVFFSIIVYSGFIISISLFFSEMVDHIGIGAIINFFTGRYTTSKVENRVFMFLDMRSSTTIAEKLGHEQYYILLNSYYADMTEAIISTAGEIYQYVGDEIVVSWKSDIGLKKNNCIQCFFLLKKQLQNRRTYYLSKFGIAPEFKAGLHCGQVTTGEVGLIKKEILFTGDVLNTTARIQSLCNELKVDLLLSDDLKKSLTLNESYDLHSKGSFELRGRNQTVDLFTLKKKEGSI